MPVGDGDLIQFGSTALRLVAVSEQSRARPSAETAHGPTIASAVDDNALALFQLGQLLCSRDAFALYQPIITLAGGETVGFEALGRSRVVGLESPQLMFAAAALPSGCLLFVNTHPGESDVPRLIASLEQARSQCPRKRIVLEIHEGAVTDPGELRRLRDRLLDLDVRFAFDDFGSGQSRLLELAEVRPDVVKFDRRLVAHIDRATEDRRRMLAGLVSWAHDFGIVSLAEGVETEAEAACCRDLGFALAQGYLFGRPEELADAVGRPIRPDAAGF